CTPACAARMDAWRPVCCICGTRKPTGRGCRRTSAGSPRSCRAIGCGPCRGCRPCTRPTRSRCELIGMDATDNPEFGALAPGFLDRAVIAVTSRMPNNWLGLRLAILLRRAVTMRLPYPAGALDVERWGLKVRLHPRDNGCEKNLLFTPQMYEPTELAELGADIGRARQQKAPFVFVDIGA